MSSDPVKANALKVLSALRESDMDGYRLLRRTSLTETDLAMAVRELGSIVSVQGDLDSKMIGEAYFSILPSDQGRAAQTMTILSLMK